MWAAWVPVFLFESCILILSVSLAIKYYKSIRTLHAVRQSSSMTPWENSDSLVYILLRDSITFPFMYVLNFTTSNTLPYLLPPFLAFLQTHLILLHQLLYMDVHGRKGSFLYPSRRYASRLTFDCPVLSSRNILHGYILRAMHRRFSAYYQSPRDILSTLQRGVRLWHRTKAELGV